MTVVKQESLEFLNGGGEMGDLIRRYDWSGSSLGPPEQWPPSLKTTLSIILHSGYPMFLWWGPELIMFHNDAYLPVLGKKHPAALGSSARDTWTEIWDDIGGIAEDVFRGEHFYAQDMRLVLDRKGFLEETYWTFSYSPIPGEHRQVGGLFCACNEETDKILRQRRLRTLKDISEISTGLADMRSVGRRSVDILARNLADIPFSALYLLESGGEKAQLINHHGFALPNEVIPETVRLDGDRAAELWQFTKVLASSSPLLADDLPLKSSDFAAAMGKTKADRALVLPLRKQGKNSQMGLLICGISPELELSEEYKSFLGLTARQITDVIANAYVFEITRHRLESERYFKQLILQSPIIIGFLKGPDFVVEAANDNILRVWGKTRDIIGKPIREAIPEIKDQVFPRLLQEVYETGVPYFGRETETRLERQGVLETIYFNFVYHPYRETDGAITGIIVIATEVTEQVEARRKIQASEERLRLALQIADMGTWEYDLRTGLLSGSARTRELFGFTDETGKRFTLEQALERIVAQDKPRVATTVERALRVESDGLYDVEFSLVQPDGRPPRTVRSRGRTFFDDSGQALLLIGTLLDITEQKRARDELESLVRERTRELMQSNAALHNQKAFVDTIIDSSVDLIAVYDKDTRLVTFNQKCEEVYERRREEIIGRRMLDIFPFAAAAHADLRRALDGETVHRLVHRSFTGRVLENFWIPLYDEGEVSAVLVIGHDNTQFLEANRKLQEVEEKNRELEQFAYLASHDLQEPLNTITSFIDLIEEEMTLPAPQDAYFGYIRGSAVRLRRLINDLLNHSRIGRQSEREIVDLNLVLEEILSDLRSTINAMGAEVRIRNLPVVQVHPAEIRLLFQHLLSNALKFSHPDRPPRIDIQARRQHGQWHFTVSDNGIGIEPRFQQRIFLIFQRLHPSETYEGSGIGLAHSKKIVELHHGKIWVESAPGEGSTFHFTISETS